MPAKSDAEREPGFRKERCVSGKFVLATFGAGLALEVAKRNLPETQWFERNPGSQAALDFADIKKMPILFDPAATIAFLFYNKIGKFDFVLKKSA